MGVVRARDSFWRCLCWGNSVTTSSKEPFFLFVPVLLNFRSVDGVLGFFEESFVGFNRFLSLFELLPAELPQGIAVDQLGQLSDVAL